MSKKDHDTDDRCYIGIGQIISKTARKIKIMYIVNNGFNKQMISICKKSKIWDQLNRFDEEQWMEIIYYISRKRCTVYNVKLIKPKKECRTLKISANEYYKFGNHMVRSTDIMNRESIESFVGKKCIIKYIESTDTCNHPTTIKPCMILDIRLYDNDRQTFNGFQKIKKILYTIPFIIALVYHLSIYYATSIQRFDYFE